VVLYLDTSALLKLFVPEPHGDDVRLWANAASLMITSAITLSEKVLAVSRRRLSGGLTVPAATRLAHKLRERWPDYVRTAVDEGLAANMTWRHGSRGMDAIHLASTCALQTAAGADNLAFAAFDEQLKRAAAAEGLIVLEPSGG